MNINIILARLPRRVHALTRLNEDDTYTVMIDDSLSREQALKELLHEISHIKGNDFSATAQATLLEHMVRESDFIADNFADINFYYHVV